MFTGFGAAISEAVEDLRALAEERMGAENGSSTGNVRRQTDRGVQDETTGAETAAWVLVHLDLPGRIRDSSGSNAASYRDQDSGEVERAVAVRTLFLPATTEDLEDGDLYEVTAGVLAGLVFRITEATTADQKIQRRLSVTAVPRPKEWA
ncbi:DUF6093 family protein [Nocardioides sp.]|uniref:DUF6093 family protein n=1 Tax=Nocardioides sp. TaxID=35761 RepID=UPI00260412C3|nr:DUF6093 family protein [Nocardioides sp.]